MPRHKCLSSRGWECVEDLPPRTSPVESGHLKLKVICRNAYIRRRGARATPNSPFASEGGAVVTAK